jgi:hypothetical protein
MPRGAIGLLAHSLLYAFGFSPAFFAIVGVGAFRRRSRAAP